MKAAGWLLAGILAGMAVWAALAVAGPGEAWHADRAHCLPVVSAPASAYPWAFEVACQEWNAGQAGATP